MRSFHIISVQGCYRAPAYFIVMALTLTTQTQLCSAHHIFVHLVGRKAQVTTTTTVPQGFFRDLRDSSWISQGFPQSGFLGIPQGFLRDSQGFLQWDSQGFVSQESQGFLNDSYGFLGIPQGFLQQGFLGIPYGFVRVPQGFRSDSQGFPKDSLGIPMDS